MANLEASNAQKPSPYRVVAMEKGFSQEKIKKQLYPFLENLPLIIDFPMLHKFYKVLPLDEDPIGFVPSCGIDRKNPDEHQMAFEKRLGD
jgi:hypothetical protein